jgi:ABC-2 type transport system ATP-binding protein
LFSSHQLDLVEHLCETIALLHHGRVVLHGDLRALKAASPNRWLRVDVAVDPSWIDPQTSTRATVDATRTRLRLAPDADPLSVRDEVRAHATIRDFGVEAPSLSELFLEAAGTEAQ